MPETTERKRSATRSGVSPLLIKASAPADRAACCYLEDLFVSEAARGHGLGRALIDDLITIARTKGWSRLYWHTNEANTRARALYDQYVASDGHIRYRMRL